MLAQTRLDVLVVPERAPHEPGALGVVACVQEDAVPDHAMAQQRGRTVEDHQVQPVAADDLSEHVRQAPDGALHRAGIRDRFVVQQNRDVDVAVGSRGAPGGAAEEIAETHRRLGGERLSEHRQWGLATALVASVLGDHAGERNGGLLVHQGGPTTRHS